MDDMTLSDYLAQGGKLTAPDNVPPRYRGELMRLMASFVDSELAGSAGFAEIINDAPGIAARIAAARIVAEKTDHAGRVLDIMGEFGADTTRYATAHPWALRVPRDMDLGAERHGNDMRLSVFHYPLTGWADAVAMNVLMGLAAAVQFTELTHISYAPLAELFRDIAKREARHTELGIEGMKAVADSEPDSLRHSLDYWHSRVATSFGKENSARFDRLAAMGLRQRRNEDLLADWEAKVFSTLAPLGLT
jgi:1,2-phenylacetyl-CoA epoxidase catalytic subunit